MGAAGWRLQAGNIHQDGQGTTEMNTKDRSARIKHIRWNLAENDRRLAESKITRDQWKRCADDGRKAIAELHGLGNGKPEGGR